MLHSKKFFKDILLQRIIKLSLTPVSTDFRTKPCFLGPSPPNHPKNLNPESGVFSTLLLRYYSSSWCVFSQLQGVKTQLVQQQQN